MIVGVPKEVKTNEYRVGIIPAGVKMLARHGHQVIIETGAGLGSSIPDEQYVAAGASIISTAEEVYATADLVMKVKEPQLQEIPLLRPGQILYAYLHLAPEPDLTKALMNRGVTGVAFETIQLPDGSLPLLVPMSEVAGRMSVQVGARFLEKEHGGRGVLLGGVPGVSRGRVAIIGAGIVGHAACKIAIGLGAEVDIIDINPQRLHYLDDIFGSRVVTLMSNEDNIAAAVRQAHLVIGAVLIPGAKAPKLVTSEMVSTMRRGTVVVDVSIDQGGCVETSRPTTHHEPTFVVHGVIHYGVPNIPGAVSRTSTFALANSTISYALAMADKGFAEAVRTDPCLAKGVNVYQGYVTYEAVACDVGCEFRELATLLG
ncbi:MAG: alanine dehydrogenase [Deltaproteobacteria bacterium]|nr:alanine dehydrogenase [Deltaproteobacteria bacterium]